MLQKLIDKAYEKHPVLWQAFISSVIVGGAIFFLIFMWQNSAFGGN
jgi:hypothetical protein